MLLPGSFNKPINQVENSTTFTAWDFLTSLAYDGHPRTGMDAIVLFNWTELIFDRMFNKVKEDQRNG